MAKQKISVTVSPDRLAQARALLGTDNASDVLDEALTALVERELERRWLVAYADAPPDDLPDDLTVDLTDVPWDSE